MKQYYPYAASHAMRLRKFEALRAGTLEALKMLDGNRADDREREAHSSSCIDLEFFGLTAENQQPRTEDRTVRAQHHPSCQPAGTSATDARALPVIAQSASRREAWKGDVDATF